MDILIPARGGSKGIPRKNLIDLNGKSLLQRSIECALSAAGVDNVFVSSEDDEILVTARRFGAIAIERPTELSLDNTSTEDVLYSFIKQNYFKSLPQYLVFMQCTNITILPTDIERVINDLYSHKYGSVHTVVPDHKFTWKLTGDGMIDGGNHDPRLIRKRRQDLPPSYAEDGGVYGFNVAKFMRKKNRFIEPFGLVVRDVFSFEIDDEKDLELARLICK